MTTIHQQNKQIHPLRPLVVPTIALVLFLAIIPFIPVMKTLDNAIIQVVHLLPLGYNNFSLGISVLGSTPFVFTIAVIVSIYELIRRRWIRASVIILSILALPAFYILKTVIHRARPITDFVIQNGLHDYSFPSGHATGSAAIYGMIVFLVLSDDLMNAKLKRVIVTACLVLIVAIGISRVYLGAHFPSDVIGGWLLALFVVSLLRSLSLYLVKRYDKPVSEAVPTPTDTAQV